MFKAIRKSFFKYLWFVLALHILNLSIDAPDFDPDSVPENLEFNDIESLVELVLEKALGFENAVAEQDELDDPDGNSVLLKKVDLDDFLFHHISFKTPPQYKASQLQEITYYTLPFYSKRYLDIFSPPPEV
ncbi:hypothetical protein [Adhaeribacter aquaticus]|uniref:hypothetical protein n=1 Tax=Adhaeribacter aquaticus TaxID=299567 RepID=UPI000686F26A|nr:hypothetical protein [Adhaeribacter aquaticus]